MRSLSNPLTGAALAQAAPLSFGNMDGTVEFCDNEEDFNGASRREKGSGATCHRKERIQVYMYRKLFALVFS